MKRLFGTLAAVAAPLALLGAATPAAAGHKCECKPAHAKPAGKPHKPAGHHARSHHRSSGHHAGGSSHLSSSAGAGGVNTYGWQRQSGYAEAAPGYGTSYGPGYGYAYEANREGGYARSYSAVDVQTSSYDSGWRPGMSGIVPAPYGPGASSGYSSHYDSGWQRPGAAPCPHPGAVMCLPAGQTPMGPPPMAYGYGASHMTVQPEMFYGGLAGGVAGPESYGGYSTGGGAVFIGSSTGGSAYASARSEAYAAAAAHSRAKAYGGRRGYKKHH